MRIEMLQEDDEEKNSENGNKEKEKGFEAPIPEIGS